MIYTRVHMYAFTRLVCALQVCCRVQSGSRENVRTCTAHLHSAQVHQCMCSFVFCFCLICIEVCSRISYSCPQISAEQVIWNSISHFSGAKMELAHRHSAFAASGVIKEEDHGTYMKFLQWDTKVLRFDTCEYIVCLIYVSVCALYTCTYIQMHISLRLLLVLVYVGGCVCVGI